MLSDVLFFVTTLWGAIGHSDLLSELSWWSQVAWGRILSITEVVLACIHITLGQYSIILCPSHLQLRSYRGRQQRDLVAKPEISAPQIPSEPLLRLWSEPPGWTWWMGNICFGADLDR